MKFIILLLLCSCGDAYVSTSTIFLSIVKEECEKAGGIFKWRACNFDCYDARAVQYRCEPKTN